MGPDRRVAAALPALLALLLVGAGAAPGGSTRGGAARADSTRGIAAAPADTARGVAAAPADSVRGGSAPADSARAFAVPADSLGGRTRPSELLPFRLGGTHPAPAIVETTRAADLGADARRIDLEVGRKVGEVTLAGALMGRRPVLLDPLPVFGLPLGAVRLPDGSTSYRTEEGWFSARGATDRTLVRRGRFGGISDLAASYEDPEATGADLLDDTSLISPVAPGPLRGPSDALARLVPESQAAPLLDPDVPMPRRLRTTLEYRKGDGDEIVTGARFFSPTIGRGLMGSFSRYETGGTASIQKSVSNRYRVTAGLPRALGHVFSVEGRLMQQAIEMPLEGSATEARAELERASLSVRAAARSGLLADDVVLILRRAKRTDIPWPYAPRGRWEMPEVALQGNLSWGDSTGGSVHAGLDAARTRVSYRTASAPEFRRSIPSARLSFGARRPLGPGGVGVDVAYDVMKRQVAEWDARASAWAASQQGSARLDIESVHSRPTWIDLWTPYRADTIFTDTSTVLYARSGNASLRPKRETGAVASAALGVGRALRLTAGLAAHHVTNDFGWLPTLGSDPLEITDLASVRGDGWVSFASLGCRVAAGPVSGRATAWVRGGTDALTPLAGSPPRRALDAEAGVRQRLFSGDLLARLSLTAHALGPRRGLIREPAQVVWDGAVDLDFGLAAAVLGFTNLFDRHMGSGVYDMETGQAEPLPGRAFHFGVVWNLWD